MRYYLVPALIVLGASLHAWKHAIASNSGSLRISGYVAPSVKTRITPASRVIPVASLQGVQAGLENGYELADFFSQSNLNTGYQVFLASENGGQLGNYQYQVTLNGAQPLPLSRQGIPIHAASSGRSPAAEKQSIRLVPVSRTSGSKKPKSLTDTLTLSIIAQ